MPTLPARILLAYSLIFALRLPAQTPALRVYADAQNNVHIVAEGGKESIVPAEKGQAGIDDVKIAADNHTAGWLVTYPDPDSSSPYAGKLVIWRDGRIVRAWGATQTFWSWSFADGNQHVAVHDGPTHGEETSHCELRDIQSGRLLASWDGDLDASSNRPAWTKGLDH